MPTKFREIFNREWLDKHTRQKPSGLYEIRCSINKVPISGSGMSIDTAAEKFIKNLSALSAGEKKKKSAAGKVLFNDFSEKWFKLVKKHTVKPVTYKAYMTDFEAHIRPFFKGKALDEITAMQIQPLFTRLNKTASREAAKVKVILNQIFSAAIAERIITFNPMQGVRVLKHQNKHGTALTYTEEKEFLQKLENSKFKLTFAIMLYGGMRRGELNSVKIEDSFLIVADGKKKLEQLQTFRKVPITPMLNRYLEAATKKEIREATGFSCDVLSRHFKRLCPSHHLHELRHTFITRCQECGVPREVVSVWAGHAADNTMTSTVYTHFSPEFMLAEGKKIDYFNRLI